MSRRRRLISRMMVGLFVLLILADAVILVQRVRAASLTDLIERVVWRVTSNQWKYSRYLGAICSSESILVTWSHGDVQHGDEPGPMQTDEITWSHQRLKMGGEAGGPGDGPEWIRRLGLRWQYRYRYKVASGGWSEVDRQLWVAVSYVNLLLLSLLAKGALFYAHRRITLPLRRVRAGLCGRCGYDLRAHGGGERCPECGAVPEQVAGAAA
jgi:hypothetical protein